MNKTEIKNKTLKSKTWKSLQSINFDSFTHNHSERKTIGIVLIGLAKTGKTTILNHLCGKQPSDDYTLTVDETHEDATITVDNVTYAISVVCILLHYAS